MASTNFDVATHNFPGGGGGDLGYTAAPTNGTVTNTAGTDATLPLADASNAGLLAPADFTKLSGIETAATEDQTAAEIQALYDSLVAIVSQAEAEAGTATTAQRWTAERVKQAVLARLVSATLSNPTFTGAINEESHAWATTTGAVTGEFDPANGTVQTVTMTGNITSVTDNMANGEHMLLGIDDGTAYTFVGPAATFVNNGGSPLALATTGYTWFFYWKLAGTLYAANIGNGA